MRASYPTWIWIGTTLLLASCRGTPARDASAATAGGRGADVEGVAGLSASGEAVPEVWSAAPPPVAAPVMPGGPPAAVFTPEPTVDGAVLRPLESPAADTTSPPPPDEGSFQGVSRAPELRVIQPAPLPGAAPATLPGPLRELRAALDDARSATSDQVLTTGGEQPLDVLVGMTRDAVRDALGEPSTCVDDVSFDSGGRGHPVAPCTSHTDWFYSFYHLPDGWVGGGPELLLRFEGGLCIEALWRFTQ